MQLRDIQENFENALLRPVWELPRTNDDFYNLFSGTSSLLKERLKIYHANVIGGAVKTLEANFPLLQKLVGEDFFKSMASAYAIKNPPRTGCLNLYGSDFDRFVINYDATKHLPYLSDVACLEQAITKASHAPDDTALDISTLHAVPHSELSDTVINMRPSVTLLQSCFPLEEIRSLCLGKTEKIPDMSKKYSTRLLIFRPELDVIIAPLAPAEFTILSCLWKGQSLGESLERAMEESPDFDLVEFLTRHLRQKTFSAFP